MVGGFFFAGLIVKFMAVYRVMLPGNIHGRQHVCYCWANLRGPQKVKVLRPQPHDSRSANQKEAEQVGPLFAVLLLCLHCSFFICQLYQG